MRETSAEALLLLAYLQAANGKHAKAASLLRGLASLLPDDARVLRPLAHTCLLDGRHAEALEAADALLRLGGEGLAGDELACTLRLKAAALWGLGRKEEARDRLEESIRAVAGPGETGEASGRAKA